jgi:hypothetical protein
MHVHFAALAVLAAMVAAGLFYRVAAALYLLGFTYAFLLDQARYLNHYYLVALLAFLLVFLPAGRAFSLDTRRRPELRAESAPAWALWLLRAQMGIVYFYAGVAKLHGDWLRGEPLRTWLDERRFYPVIGPLLTQEWLPWFLSYGGLLLDLLAAPLLLWRRSRAVTFGFVVFFHLTNFLLFSIGIFPWLALAATALFFEPDWPRRAFRWWVRARRREASVTPVTSPRAVEPAAENARRRRWILAALGAYLAVQLAVPLRHLLYPGDVHWTEEGHRFSWRMKLRGKDGWVRFLVRDPRTGESWAIDPGAPPSRWGLRSPESARPGGNENERGYLTRRQVRKMAGTPDMILQFAHHLAERFREAGRADVEVRARAKVSLNGRVPQLLVDPAVDLAREPRTLLTARWILPLAEPLRRR